jgi:transmembrane sensor
MADNPERLRALLQKRLEEELSFEEQMELDELFTRFADEKKRSFFSQPVSEDELRMMLTEYRAIMSEADEIEDPILPAPVISMPQRKSLWLNWKVAASVVVAVSIASYFIVFRRNEQKPEIVSVNQQVADDIEPGKYNAILRLGDGRTIVLDSAGQGLLAQQGGAKIVNENGSLKYDLPGQSAGKMVYNNLTTAAGQFYSVMLSDGSKVWLNASSSIDFPTAFLENTREVKLTGEAYFEIAKNREKPFYVNVNGMQVQVLGTHFNINAYDDEDAIKTSLLEGSVKVVSGEVSGMLEPGQQAALIKTGKEDKAGAYRLEKKTVDMDEVVAWKNGLFQFNEAGITTIMRQIGRWYNVEIAYKSKVPLRRFVGKISRDAQLSEVLKILELSDVKFTVEGKKIIVQ